MKIIALVQASNGSGLESMVESLRHILNMMPIGLNNNQNVDGQKKGWLKYVVQNLDLSN